MGANIHTFWIDERVAFLRAAVDAKKSASEIATEIGHGCTRGAVVGKCHRLGLVLNGGGLTNPQHQKAGKIRRRKLRIKYLQRKIVVLQSQLAELGT
jgi:hypothetical protein